MKKLIYLFSLLLLACACNLEDFEPQTSRDADKVSLSLSLSVPEAQSLTRAMGEQPDLKSLHLVVFDQNGMLVEYAQAQHLQQATVNKTLYTFDVELTISDTPRHIHFVGNSPEAPKFGMETDVMTAMETKSGADAYWYRKTIDKLEAKEDGTATDETKAAFGIIPLVRNFAQIKVTSGTGIFELESYAVAGRPKKGKVAPYNRKTGDFQDYVKSDGSMKTYQELTRENYDAFSPTGVELDFGLSDSDFTKAPKYVYERETPLSNASYVIVKGKYNNGTDPVYYKINLRDNDGNYVPLRRNFRYDITISSVTRDGYKELSDAVASSGSGDISTDMEYISLTNISDGEVRLSVEYTSKTLVPNDPKTLQVDPVTLQVEFEKVGTSDKLYLGDVEVKIGAAGETGAAIQKADKTDGPTSGGGSYTYTVTPENASGAQKTQSLIIIGHYKIGDTDLTISREVSYTVMEKREMSAVCIPSEVIKEQGQEFDLQITIPDGLGESMFPLEFSIEAVKLSITPKNDNLPVSSGVSTIEDTGSGRVGKSSFWFVKTLSYEKYKALTLNSDQKKSFLCHFATNMDISATDIYVSNPYFNQTKCNLGNYDPLNFQDLAFDKPKYPTTEGEAVEFTFKTSALPSQGNITVTLSGLIPADDEDKLSYAGVDANNNPTYTLEANATSYKLKLVSADADSDFNVKLEAHHFVTAEASATRGRQAFSNLTLPATKVGKGQSVEFSFTYADSVVPVTLKLTGLESDDSRIVQNGTEYVFTPNTQDKTQTIRLKTISWGSQIGVEIVAAQGYNVPVSVTAKRTITSTVSYSGDYLWSDISYSLNSSLGDALGSFTPNNQRKSSITIESDFGEDPSRKIYFWYKPAINNYIASTTLADLADDGSATLTFKKQ